MSVWISQRDVHQLNLGATLRGLGLSLSFSSCPSSLSLQFALYKKMTQAAILIQSKFRSYYEQKRFQQSRRAAVLIQQHYRSYRRRPGPPHRPPGSLPTRTKYDSSPLSLPTVSMPNAHRPPTLSSSSLGTLPC